MQEDSDSQIIERMNELLRHYNLNVNSFSKKIGVSSLSGAFLGKNRFGLKVFQGISKAFPEVDINYLMGKEGTSLILGGQPVGEDDIIKEMRVVMDNYMLAKNVREHGEILNKHERILNGHEEQLNKFQSRITRLEALRK